MSDSVWFFAYPEPTPPNAGALLDDTIADLTAQGIIRRNRDPDAILGDPRGPVHRPAQAAVRLARPYESFADLLTNGAEFCGSLIFNYGPLNAGTLDCPRCGVTISDEEVEAFNDQIDQIGEAVADADFSDAAVTCIACGAETSVNDWASEGGFIIAGFGVGLWNWPYGTPLMDAVRDSLERNVGRPGLASDGYRI
ncbi:hypothetical protein [Roseovarius sp.]|uniref:hypothetical protein n=1 Tax=Roseovarius sp. TaxID=1486281 RepID=UPI003D0C562F